MITQNYLSKGHRVRPGTVLNPSYICIHSTGNPSSTAKNERAWLDNPTNTRQASWHLVIDETEAIAAIPFNEVAWHAENGNKESIGIEICESGNRANTVDHAARVVAQLLKERNWGVEKLKRHYDYTGKSCPSIFMANNWAGWNDFKLKVQSYLMPSKTVPQWQIEALNTVSAKLKLDKTYWTEEKLKEPITVGELMALLNKLS